MKYKEKIGDIVEQISKTAELLEKYPHDPILGPALVQDIGMAVDVLADWITSVVGEERKNDVYETMASALYGKAARGFKKGDVVRHENREYIVLSYASGGGVFLTDREPEEGSFFAKSVSVEELEYVSPPGIEDLDRYMKVKSDVYEMYKWLYEEEHRDPDLLIRKLRDWELL